MANKQIVVKSFPDLPTVTLKIFPEGLGATIETKTPLPDGNDGSLYVATFANLSEARYRWNLYSEGELVTDGFVTVEDGTGPHFDEDMVASTVSLSDEQTAAVASSVALQLGGSGLAAASATFASVGEVEGMPGRLVIGDAYVESNGQQIDLFLKDANGKHITAFGSKQLSAVSASMRFSLVNTPAITEVAGTATWNNPGDDVAPFFRIQIESAETAKAKPVYDYLWQLVLNWDGNTANEITPVFGTIRFEPKIWSTV